MRSLLRYSLMCSLLAAGGFVAWGIYTIATSRSSTAAVGYVFLPVYAVMVAIAVFAVSWAILYALRYARERLGNTAVRYTTGRLLVLALVVLCGTALLVSYQVARYRLLGAVQAGTLTPVGRQQVLGRAISSHDYQVLAALARNSGTPADDLARIYESSLVEVGVHPYYGHESVLAALAQNPQAPSPVLAALARSGDTSLRVMVAVNPGAPVETLSALARDKDASVRYWLPTNPKISQELLLQLANDPDKSVRESAKGNLRYRGFDKEATP